MKQILQDLKTGSTELTDIPCPQLKHGHNLIQTSCSLISVGTERMLIDFGKAGLIDKAKQQPDKVRMVLDKIKTDGLFPTIDAVRAKLDQPLPMGYCHVGTILETGDDSPFRVGNRVASNGHHAEIVCVPHNLCAKIPDNVSDESASFTVIGAIALQGIRLANPTLGECFAVTGLGLVGLMTVQLLLAQGCRVVGIDFDSGKCSLAKAMGADVVDLSKGENPLAIAEDFSRGRGVDGVIVTASTKSNEPMHQAANMCRKRGRVVLVGVVGLELSRDDFFKKEISFQVSCSYGPGRYDSFYEEQGNDYPIGYVRWTEQRNFEAVLDMMSAGSIDVSPLISHRFDFTQALDGYKVLAEDRSSLGIILNYPSESPASLPGDEGKTIAFNSGITEASRAKKKPVVGFIGAGNYATRTLIPAFQQTDCSLCSVASSGGVSGVYAGKKFGFKETTTDTKSLLSHPTINTLVITTRHNSHAKLTCDALTHGKNVFIEKPLCLTLDELEEIRQAYETAQKSSNPPLLMVGFNRRYAPQIQKIKSLLTAVKEPKAFIMTVNAGAIPRDHWTQDLAVGGGRIIGEACHFIDLLRFLAEAQIESSTILRIDRNARDTATIQLLFADGSIGTIHYLANGNKGFPKERLEVFAAGGILQLNNFRTLKGYSWPGFKKMNLLRQDKGQKACAKAFIDAIDAGGGAPISIEEILEIARISIDLAYA